MSGNLIVTGASRGIGAAIARMAGHGGWQVCVNYRGSPGKAAEVVADIEAAGGKAFAYRADAGCEDEIVAMYAAMDERFGRVDAVINNAGIDHETTIAESSWADYIKVFNVNVFGLMVSCREAVRRMSIANGGKGGAVVNIGSISSRTGGLPKDVIYTASKGAVDAFTHGLAKEAGPQGVRVTCVRPGVIETDIFEGNEYGLAQVKEMVKTAAPLGRIGQAEEVAHLALWLASEEASYCTATCYDVSGGR